MAQQEIETILCRHLASHLQAPVLIVDPEGNLLFYNEAAEPIIGQRFSESGAIPAVEWAEAFQVTNFERAPLGHGELPHIVALAERRPVHMKIWIVGLDGKQRCVETTCLPLIGQANRFLGAVAFFWELDL